MWIIVKGQAFSGWVLWQCLSHLLQLHHPKIGRVIRNIQVIHSYCVEMSSKLKLLNYLKKKKQCVVGSISSLNLRYDHGNDDEYVSQKVTFLCPLIIPFFNLNNLITYQIICNKKNCRSIEEASIDIILFWKHKPYRGDKIYIASQIFWVFILIKCLWIFS